VCGTTGDLRTFHGTAMSAVEVDKFIAFGVVKHRAKIGLNVGIGVGTFKGPVDVDEFQPFTQTFPVKLNPNPETHSTVDAGDAFALKHIPLGKVEFAVAAIATSHVQVRFTAGLAFPGITRFDISARYFFGRSR
jgi:hypothetical protein